MPREPEIEFDWDEHNEQHLKRHGISPDEFEAAFSIDPEFREAESVEGEERYHAVSRTDRGRLLVLIFTYRGDAVRPITAFDAPKGIARQYLKSRGA
jgi:uncharacterized protein